MIPAQDADAQVSLHADLTAVVCNALGLPEPEAYATACKLAEGLRQRFPGQYLGEHYLSGGTTRSERARRNAEIRRAFTGHNHQSLAEKYGVTERTIYRIVTGT